MAGFLKSCFYWVVSILVGLFSILFVIGFMAERRNAALGPRLQGAGPEDAEEKVRMYIRISSHDYSFFFTLLVITILLILKLKTKLMG